MIQVSGTFQSAGCAAAQAALAQVSSSGLVQILSADSSATLAVADINNYQFGHVIPGLAVDLQLKSGAFFVPDDRAFRWPQLNKSQLVAEWLEKHWTAVLVSLVAAPLFLWVTVAKIIPAAANASIGFIPNSAIESLGEQTLFILDKTLFSPSELSAEEQQQILTLWDKIHHSLPPGEHGFNLIFREWSLGANAMALPEGTVILTDDIVHLMSDNPDALTAVLFHEVGHVEHRHHLKILVQSTATSFLFAMLFGELEGVSEVLLGTGTFLMENAFSRDMEREADQYAHQQLLNMGIPASAFATAIELLSSVESDNETSEETHWLEYISTHPGTLERIRSARSVDQNPD